jgi:hypothetical protein
MSGKEYTVKNMILLEDDLKIQKKYNGEMYTIKYPLPQDRKNIARRIASEFDGLPMDSFTINDRSLVIRDAEIDHLIEEADHWQGADECLDEELKNWLFEECRKWQRAFQEKLKKNKFTKRSKKGEVSS